MKYKLILTFFLISYGILFSQYTGGNGSGSNMSRGNNSEPQVFKGGIGMGAAVGVSNEQPLPVKLNLFNAVVIKSSVTLNWQTASEENNSGFEILRSSYENKDFWMIAGFVKGQGTKNESTDYTFSDSKLNTGKYYYKLRQIDYNGNSQLFNLENEIEIGIPSKFYLSQNYPNPFNPVTNIDYEIPVDTKVSVIVYDITGKTVSTLVNEIQKAGYYTLKFDASKISTGIYFYRFSTEKFNAVKKLVILK